MYSLESSNHIGGEDALPLYDLDPNIHSPQLRFGRIFRTALKQTL
jgi:hypothetical protein